MRQYLSNRKIFEKKICQGQYSLARYLARFLNLRTFLSALLILSTLFLLKVWSNKVNFGQYSYAFSFETVLEQRSSRFHDVIVAESGPLLMLRFDARDIQGVINLQNPYVMLHDYMRLHLLCLLWHPEPERILIIGLGAGILPQIFHSLSPNTIIDIVEIDPIVVDFARKYFDFNMNKSLVQLHVADARRFVERQRSKQYDIIIVDVFTVHTHIPHALRTVECFGEYLRILKPTGLISANFLYGQESRYRQTYASVSFKRIYRGIMKDNYVLIGLNADAKIFSHTILRSRANDFQHSKPLPEFDWVAEINNIHHGNDDQWNTSAAIFTDQLPEDSASLSERN